MGRVTASSVGAALSTVVRPGHHRAVAFAHLLEEPANPSTDELRALVEVANQLRAIPTQRTGEIDPEFRSRLRQRLVAVATVQGLGANPAQEVGNGHPAGRHGSRSPASASGRTQGRRPRLVGLRRRVLAGTAALAMVAAIGGTGAASTSALPGDALYGVKRVVESMRLALASSDLDRGHLELQMATRRLSEVDMLATEARGGSPSDQPAGRLDAPTAALVEDTLADMDESTRAGAALLIRVHEQQGTASPVTYLERFARGQRTHLAALLPTLPPSVRADAGASLALLDRLLERTGSVFGQSAAKGESASDRGPTVEPQCASPCVPESNDEARRPPGPDATANPSPTPEGASPQAGLDLGDPVRPEPSDGPNGSGGAIDRLVGDLLGGEQAREPSPATGGSAPAGDAGDLVDDTVNGATDTLKDVTGTLG